MLRIYFGVSSVRTEMVCTTWREVFRTLDQESRLFGHGHVTSKLHQNRLVAGLHLHPCLKLLGAALTHIGGAPA